MKKPLHIKDVWFILPDGTNIFDTEFRSGALSVVREHALPKIRLSNQDAVEKAIRSTGIANVRNLAVIAYIHSTSLLKMLGKAKIPLVLLGDELAEKKRKAYGLPLSFCSVDNTSIGQMAADYLHEQGRFASYVYADAFKMPHQNKWSLKRYESFVNTLREHGFKGIVPRISAISSSPLADAKAFVKAIENLPRPIAVFTCNDRTAREIVSFCDEANIHIPDDVAILGVDNETDICELCPVPISSIKVEHYRLGRTAMHIILRILEGGARRDKTILCPPVRVVERSTTKRLAPNDRFVGAAVEFIRSADLATLDVTAVVRASKASRSYLEKCFKAETGRTILEAIHKRKMDEVKSLLLDTDKSVAIIAAETGFPSTSGLCSMFRRLVGLSASEFRASRQPKPNF